MTSDEQLLQDDVSARSEALDVTRSFIVQAPAGSGKTELLIQRYLKLLGTVEHPEEIIAITFTRKAAAEMQLRVLQALRRSQRGDVPAQEHERRTFDLATRALERSAGRAWHLIANPRRMRILTLDALNASIARTQPLNSPNAGARIVVGAELTAIHQDASLATLDWIAESGDMRDATVEVLRHVDNNTGLYASYLSQMLATRDQWLPFIGSGLLTEEDASVVRGKFEESLSFAIAQHLQRTARELAAADCDELVELLDYAATNLAETAVTANPICCLAGIAVLPSPTTDQVVAWRGIAELLLTQKGQFRKKVDKRQGFPAGEKVRKDAMQALLERLTEHSEFADSLHGVKSLPPASYSDEQWAVLLALFRLLPLAVTELRRLFSEQGIVDHIDVALQAAAALGSAEDPGEVALLLDYQVRHLLVDEMQDTSAAQYRMLETLTAGWVPGDGRSLYCVGDPMQSIYRFRNAEVGQFLLAREYGIGQIRLQALVLRRNFRSGEHLVDWFNTVFPTVLAARDNPLRGAVSYSSAVAAEHLLKQGRCVVHPVLGGSSEEEASAGCRLIAATLAENPDDDMAVLVRGRTQLPELLADLRRAGLPYRAIEIDRLTDLPEIIDVLALTRAASHQGDRIAWLALLRAPWIGLDWSDLHRLVRNDTNSSVWTLLQDAERLVAMSSFARQAIAGAMDVLTTLTAPRRSQSLRDLVERAWFALGGPGVLDDDYAIENVYRYFDVLGKLERAGTVTDVGALESILDMERVSSNDNARLQVMTMHRAKGLQFDHVLLYGLGRQPGHGNRRVLSWFDLPDPHGKEQKVISPVGPRAVVENDPVHRYIELTETDKERHELARLLYVACTRARQSLHLMGTAAIAGDGENVKPARSDSLLHLLWPFVSADFQLAVAGSGAPVSEAEPLLWANPELRRFSKPWTLPAVNKLQPDSPQAGKDVVDAKVEFYWVGSDARIAGTLVHRCLQLVADSRDSELQIDNETIRRLTTRWLAEYGIRAEAAGPITARVLAAVAAALADEKGRWILDGDGFTELALSGVYDGELISVVLDRVRFDDDGTHWIIDYKSSSHEGGNLDGFLQVESDRYRPQLARYAAIYSVWAATGGAKSQVRCALYFPLLKSFVEVTV